MDELGREFPGQVHLLSGLTRQASERDEILFLDPGSLHLLIDTAVVPDGPLDAMDTILLHVHRVADKADSYIDLSSIDYPLVFARDYSEFDFLLQKLLGLKFLESDGHGVRLTLDGWRRVAELRKERRDSNQAFVAMWFAEQLDSAWAEGFRPALEQCGYQPIRIDLVEHNEKICDRIVAEIRKSGLLVADFTGNRGGVYFEAGLAMGLNLPVIWTCREDHVQELHFDTRQYSHIVWTSPDDLNAKLIHRIEATAPKKRD